MQRYKISVQLLWTDFKKNAKKVIFFTILVVLRENRSVKRHFCPALGIGRATVLCNNAGLANPFKAGRSQGVDVSRYSKGL